MNMQSVNGSKLIEVKGRLVTLKEVVRSNQFAIQVKNDTRSAKQELAKRHKMSPAEFIAIYPAAPDMAPENASLTSKKTLLGGRD